jgi:hypothetical protein
MDDLPQDPTKTTTTAPQQAPQPISVGLNKEINGAVVSAELPLKSASPEIQLPKEVSSAGVTVHPTTVKLPQNVVQAGLTPVAKGTNAVPTGQGVTLPLSDEQIVQGLHKGVKTSWRWFAEWCVRRMKQMHLPIPKTK